MKKLSFILFFLTITILIYAGQTFAQAVTPRIDFEQAGTEFCQDDVTLSAVITAEPFATAYGVGVEYDPAHLDVSLQTAISTLVVQCESGSGTCFVAGEDLFGILMLPTGTVIAEFLVTGGDLVTEPTDVSFMSTSFLAPWGIEGTVLGDPITFDCETTAISGPLTIAGSAAVSGVGKILLTFAALLGFSSLLLVFYHRRSQNSWPQ